MHRQLAAAAVVLGAVLPGPALADCSTEVQLAVQALGKQKFLRKETQAISESGPFKMVIEYQIPERMRQIVTPLTENKPVESIVVGDKAWTKSGDGWKESPKAEAEQLSLFMIRSSAQMYQDVGKFECLGIEHIDGRKLRAYRGLPPDPPVKLKEGEPRNENEAVRMIYIDAETGLPARSIFARRDMLDKPLFREDYTYPADIKIEPPADVKK